MSTDVATAPEVKGVYKASGGIIDRLKKGVVLGGEGYLFELERRGYVKAGAFVPEVVLDHPEAVRQLHREFLRAGAEVIVAFTYYAHRDKMRLIGRENDLEPLNLKALQIAKEVAAEGGALVAGNICNSWVYDHEDAEATGAIVRKMYDEQVGWAAKAGVDFIIAETIEYVGEALIALEVIKKYKLPAMITYTTVFDKTKDGYDYVEACKILEQKGCEIVGFNCGRGPETMMPLLKRLRPAVKCFVAAQPVPYATTPDRQVFHFLQDRKGQRAFPLALERHLHSRFEMAEFAKEAKELGVDYIGICCGGAPYHVREMAEALGRKVPASRYTADMSLHGTLGNEKVVRKAETKFLEQWK